MKTINEPNREPACHALGPAELEAIQGGSPTLPLPPPSSAELVALYRQAFVNHGFFFTVKANPSLIEGQS
jgi:hypothetical protein